MSATSITGKGPGESFGLRKPNNSCGPCGGSCGSIEVEAVPLPKIGCFSSIISCNNRKILSCSSISIKTC